MKPPKICTYPGCGNLTHKRRCKEHERAYERLRAPHQRYYQTAEWRRLRKVVIERDKGLCQECGAENARQVAHIIARRQGGPDEPHNLRLLCDSCHSRETALDQGWGKPRKFF